MASARRPASLAASEPLDAQRMQESELLPGRHYFLDEVEAIRILGREFFTRQEIFHCVAPTRALSHAERRAASGHDSALHFKLREAAVVSRDSDIRCEHQFDCYREGNPFERDDDGLCASRFPQIERIHLVRRQQGFTFPTQRHDLRHVQTCSEMIAFGIEHTNAQLVAQSKS